MFVSSLFKKKSQGRIRERGGDVEKSGGGGAQ
jgi:hypothetical protein